MHGALVQETVDLLNAKATAFPSWWTKGKDRISWMLCYGDPALLFLVT